MTTVPALGQFLQPGREVGRLARYPALLRLAHAKKIADNNQSSGNANARIEAVSGRRQIRNTIDQREPCPHRPFCVVLMGLRDSRSR